MDVVNHPSHYNTGKIEVITFIEDKELNFNRGNVVKYTVRAGIKETENEVQDLEKARWYLNREIAAARRRQNARNINSTSKESTSDRG